MKVEILFKKLVSDAIIPAYQTDGASGMDLHSIVDAIIEPGESKTIPTGLAVAIPIGYEGQVRPRSGLAAKNQITVVNTPGTVDSDYRGEIKVILINLGKKSFHINKGDRIAQFVIVPVIQAKMTEVLDLDQTDRGTNGFGSTGV